MGITWATPGRVSSRGRSTQSAYSRTAMALILASSTGRAISITSPMIDDTGPMRGTTPAGSCSCTRDRRSLTICRAR